MTRNAGFVYDLRNAWPCRSTGCPGSRRGGEKVEPDPAKDDGTPPLPPLPAGEGGAGERGRQESEIEGTQRRGCSPPDERQSRKGPGRRCRSEERPSWKLEPPNSRSDFTTS